MFEPVERDELSWLKAWLLKSNSHYLPHGHIRQLVILHPGASVDHTNPYVPVVGPYAADGTPAHHQIKTIANILVDTFGSDTTSYAALYDGTPDIPWATDVGRVAAVVESNVTYAVIRGRLAELLSYDWPAEAIGIEWVSMLWPANHTWFLTSDPDSAFTVVGCDNVLAEKFLTSPSLSALEIPGYRWDIRVRRG